MAVIEVVTAFYIEVPAAAIVFAALFLVIAWFARRSPRAWPIIVLALMFVIEVVFVPTYERNGAADWIVQMAALLVSLVGLVGAAVWLAQRRRARDAPRTAG
jgi:cell division protein FtsW (lipid II flippase)